MENEELNKKLELLYGRPPNLAVSNKGDTPLPSTIILDNNAFLRKLSKLHLWLLIGLVGAFVFLVYMLTQVSSRPPITLGYVTDTQNRIVELTPSNVRSVTDEDVTNYAAKITKAMHRLSFVDYIDQITRLENEFISQDAFTNYQQAMLDSRTLEMITSQKAVSWLEPASAPQIIDFDEDGLEWLVKMDVVWYLGGGALTTSSGQYTVQLIIKQVPRSKNLSGLAVSKYIMEER